MPDTNNVIEFASKTTAKKRQEMHNNRVMRQYRIGKYAPLTDEQKYDCINKQLEEHSTALNGPIIPEGDDAI